MAVLGMSVGRWGPDHIVIDKTQLDVDVGPLEVVGVVLEIGQGELAARLSGGWYSCCRGASYIMWGMGTMWRGYALQGLSE